MQLRLESRPVGDVLIVQCQGRIMVGKEVNTLHYYVQDSFTKYIDIVLQLDQVEFIDSSGLGALVRLMQAARAKGGDLKLSGVPPNIRKTLEVTNLLRNSKPTTRSRKRSRLRIWARATREAKSGTQGRLFFACTTPRTCAPSCAKYWYAAGYNALTALTMSDALILLKATKAKRVVISAQLQTFHGRPAQQVVSEIDPAISLIVLDENFANQDPGEAAEKLLSSVGRQ